MKVFALCSTDLIYTLPLGFKEAGHEVMKSGPISEDKITRQIKQFKPDLIISMGWNADQFLEPQLITRRVVEASGIPHVYWSIEDPSFTEEFCIPFMERVKPDFVFSICPETVEQYKRMGIKCAHLDFGYSDLIHHPVPKKEDYKYYISVVANLYPKGLFNNEKFKRYDSIETLILPLLKENIRIDFWGRDWVQSKIFLGYDIPKKWIHGYLPYLETNDVYNSSLINIGLQNTDHLLTIRTYEILAAGGFLLTKATTRVKNSFKLGEQLVASSSPEETLKLVKYYLSHPEERRKIAMQAPTATVGRTYKERAEYAIEVLRREGILKNAIY
ncbi:glycosyltransferase [Clostridium sp. DJ247]|uniref:CgeB family protein n=1 Tax=Clostridium sp. DJ247 TaxID=2726188 RepID=UPI0016251EC4|nr:glycosyltransferase [Clostridium sp. DJ247]MBC2580271.1 glycosyltransferase [Clostridium sp. DJ247]